MTKTVKYIGTQVRWPELAITGKQTLWQPGQTDERSDTQAAQLLATGLFSDVDATLLPEQKVVQISGVVSGAGNVETPGALALSVGQQMADADRLLTTRGRPLLRWAALTAANGAAVAFGREALMFEPSLGAFLKLPGNASASSTARPNAITPIFGGALSSAGLTGLVVQVRGPARQNPTDYVPLRVRLCSDSTGNNWVGLTLLIPCDGLEHWIVGSNWTAGQGTFVVGTSNITHVRVEDRNDGINVLGYTGLQPGETAYVGQVYVNPKARAKALIRFDDGFGTLARDTATFTADGITQAWTARSLLRQFGFRGSVAVSARRIGQPNAANGETFATWAELRTLYDEGWDMFVQSGVEPADNAQNGARLLGPFGWAPKGISAVNTGTGVLTASSAHNFLPAGTYNQFPLIFTGTDLPAPLVAGAIYWARSTGAADFTLHPTEDAAVGNTAQIVLTSAGVAANFFYRHAYATADESGILADYEMCRSLILANGMPGATDIVALNQGAGDIHVGRALARFGCRLTWGTFNATGGSTTAGARLAVGRCGDARGLGNTLVGGPILAGIPGGVQTDGAATELQARQYVQACVAAGAIFGNYHHRINATNGLVLAAFLDEVRIQQAAGLVDVCTPSEVRDYLAAFRPIAAPFAGTAI